MNKRTPVLILTTADGATERMPLADFVAKRPDLAEAGRRVAKTGQTEAHPGLYIARGAHERA